MERSDSSHAQAFAAPFPFRLLHLDSVRVYNNSMRQRGARSRAQSSFGLAVLLGAAAFIHARDTAGCTRAELLAINDGNAYAQRLVGFYARIGFVTVAEVAQRAADVPHLLVWGGAGTRMDGDVNAMLAKWAPAVRGGT